MALTLEQVLAGEIYGFLLVLVRVGAALSMLPGFGEMAVPMRARLAAALAVALALSAVVPGLPAGPPAAPSDLLAQIAGEFAAGMVIGIGARILFAGLQIAGQIMAQTAGLSNIFALPGTGFEAGSVVGGYLMIGGLVLIFVTDLHHTLLGALLDSYRLMPAATLPAMGPLAQITAGAVTDAFRLAAQVAAPFLVLGFVYNVGLGLINRAMPHFAVFFIGLPVSILGGFVLMAVTLSAVLTGFLAAYGGFLQRFGG